MATERAVRSAAREMNKVMDLNPPMDANASIEQVTDDVIDAIVNYMTPKDVFSEATQAVIDELNPNKVKKPTYVEVPPDDEDDVNADVGKTLPSGHKQVPIPVKGSAKGKAKTESTTPKAEKGRGVHTGSLAEYMDGVIEETGTWDDMTKKCVEEVERRKLEKNFTVGILRAHYKFRIKRNPKYFGDLKMTLDGIE